MPHEKSRRRFLAGAGSIATLTLAGCAGSDDGDDSTDEPNADEQMSDETGEMGEAEPTTFTVRIENTGPTDFYGDDTATGGQIWITPGAWAVHTGSNPIFEQGDPASVGLEALAEAGPPTGFEGQPGLVDELPEIDTVVDAGAYTPSDTVADPNDPMGTVPGAPPIAPGGAFEFEVEGEPGQLFNFASMYVPSNDVFVSSAAGIELFDEGEPVSGEVGEDIALWDAGTELNGRPGVDRAGAPLQAQNGGPMAGLQEGVVHRLDTIDDGFDYADASEVVDVAVTHDGDGSFTVRIENTGPTDFYGDDTATGGQIWITPGAWAVHTGSNPIFEQGDPASVGLEALAEAGPPTGFEGQPGLVDELPEIDTVVDAGAYTPSDTVADPNDPMGTVPGAPPIAPGGAFEFEVEADPGERLSFASMYVPSNDVFIAPEPAIELYHDGEPVEGGVAESVSLWDAGTELNGRPGVDRASAPLQAQNGGPMAGPEEGVVHRLDTIDDGFDYADASEVVSVVIEPQ